MLTPATASTLADAVGTVARAMDPTEPLEFVEHMATDDLFRRGKALFVVPGLWDSMPGDLLKAARARRAAAVTGQCPLCRACTELATGTLRHGQRCLATDERVGPLFMRWGRRVGAARGRRLQEMPDAAA